MAIITASILNSILDNACGYYLDILGTSGSGFGYGTGGASWGASIKSGNISTAVTGSGDLSLINTLATAVLQTVNNCTGAIAAGGALSPLLFAVQNNIIGNSPTQTVTNLNSYLTYLNTSNSGSYWAALQNPAWNVLGGAWFVGQTPSAWNVYADSPGGGVDAIYSAGLGTLIVGTGFTAHDVIDSTKYAGGFPALVVTGLTGTGTVTITGTARNPASYQSTVAGVTWTAAVTTNGTVVLTPGTAPAGSLILAVSAISAAVGVVAGTLQVVSQAPAGRPVEP